MTQISEELMLIINLKNAALNHKEHCDTNCNVSLMQLKMAAIHLFHLVRLRERKEASDIINEMPVI